VFDYGVDSGTPYLVMERLEGEDLAARLKRDVRLPLSVVNTLVAQVARALEFAHAAGIVHRDLKPKNIFFARARHGETVKLIDFGLAKPWSQPPGELCDQTRSGVLLGSPHHISPEQLGGGELDARCDLWAFAVVLFRALTGKQPFTGRSLRDLFAAITTMDPPRASALAPSLPKSVDRFFDEALDKDPDRRFRSAQALADAFAAIALTEEVATRALSAASRPEGPAASTCSDDEVLRTQLHSSWGSRSRGLRKYCSGEYASRLDTRDV
jgi:serine/threonine-protein kinase